MTALLTLTRIEMRKLTARKLLWVELALLGLLVLALHGALAAALQNPQGADLPPEALAELRAALRWPQGLRGALTFANGGELGGLFVVVLVAAFTAQEYTWHTVGLWLSRGVSRPRYLAAKALALLPALAALVLVTLLSGAVATGLYTWHSVGALPWQQVAWAELLVDGGRVLLTLLPYAALTLAVAVLTRSTLVTVGLGLGYTLLVENLAVEVLSLLSPDAARLSRYLPTMLAKAVLQPLQSGMQAQVGVASAARDALLAPGPAALGLLAYTAAGLALAWWAFRRQDIPTA